MADQFLVAVGRKPALDTLRLEAAGVLHNERGIPTDPTLRTNVAHIWAAGDITSRYPFTHVASDQGALAARNAFSIEPVAFDDRVIPWVTYTDPELARVGQTEAELREAGIEYRVGRVNFDKLDRAITDNQTVGSVTLLADADGRILGGHILGANAGELIAPIVYAMRFGLTAKMMAEAILPYPTLAEAVRWLGALGGHLGRRRDGAPGTEVLWRGLQLLDMAVQMYLLFTGAAPPENWRSYPEGYLPFAQAP